MDIIINAARMERPKKARPLAASEHYWVNFLSALGYPKEASPLAHLLSYQQRALEKEESVLIASPIYWQASHNDAVIAAFGEALQMSEEIARIWFAELSQFLEQDGFRLVYYDAYHWLVYVKNRPVPQTPNVDAMRHRSWMPVLSEMDSYWQRLLTEIQMFMSSHPLNMRKDSVYPVNGLWFWGAGTLDKPVDRSIYTDSMLVLKAFPTAEPIMNFNHPVNAQALILLEQPQPRAIQYLESLVSKKSVNWCWNNQAYHIPLHGWRRWLSWFR